MIASEIKHRGDKAKAAKPRRTLMRIHYEEWLPRYIDMLEEFKSKWANGECSCVQETFDQLISNIEGNIEDCKENITREKSAAEMRAKHRAA